MPLLGNEPTPGVIFSGSPNAILPFISGDETVVLNRDNSVTFDLRIDPENPDSPKVRFTIRKIT
jgi:hypothetical protein